MRYCLPICCLLVLGLLSPIHADDLVSVVIYDHTGNTQSPTNLSRILTPEAGFALRRATAEQIRNGMLDGADVVIFPGGSGSKQSANLEALGRLKVQNFVRKGGGYVGICAGAYLASAEYPWSLHIINTRVLDRKHWARGKGVVTLSLSKAGREMFTESRAEVTVKYAQGPLLAPAIDGELSAYTPLALYESEIAEKGAPSGIMVGTTAIAAGEFGAGRVLCFSPHPEKGEGPHKFISAGVRWTSGQNTSKSKSSESPEVRELEGIGGSN